MPNHQHNLNTICSCSGPALVYSTWDTLRMKYSSIMQNVQLAEQRCLCTLEHNYPMHSKINHKWHNIIK